MSLYAFSCTHGRASAIFSNPACSFRAPVIMLCRMPCLEADVSVAKLATVLNKTACGFLARSRTLLFCYNFSCCALRTRGKDGELYARRRPGGKQAHVPSKHRKKYSGACSIVPLCLPCRQGSCPSFWLQAMGTQEIEEQNESSLVVRPTYTEHPDLISCRVNTGIPLTCLEIVHQEPQAPQGRSLR